MKRMHRTTRTLAFETEMVTKKAERLDLGYTSLDTFPSGLQIPLETLIQLDLVDGQRRGDPKQLKNGNHMDETRLIQENKSRQNGSLIEKTRKHRVRR